MSDPNKHNPSQQPDRDRQQREQVQREQQQQQNQKPGQKPGQQPQQRPDDKDEVVRLRHGKSRPCRRFPARWIQFHPKCQCPACPSRRTTPRRYLIRQVRRAPAAWRIFVPPSPLR